MALWSGRFEEGVSEFTQEFGASLPVDKAMYKQDIAGSMAHARMLADQGVISHEDAEAITAGLAQIERDIEEGNFVFDINNEDIHMSIEAVLTERIGDAGARLHTGRSRNDQVITDTRLYAKELCRELMGANLRARRFWRLQRRTKRGTAPRLYASSACSACAARASFHGVLLDVHARFQSLASSVRCGRYEPARFGGARRHHLSARP